MLQNVIHQYYRMESIDIIFPFMNIRKNIQKRSSKLNLIKFSEHQINQQLSSLNFQTSIANNFFGMTLLKRPNQRTSIKANETATNQMSKLELQTHQELEQNLPKNVSTTPVPSRKNRKFNYSFLNTIISTSPIQTPSNVIKSKIVRLSNNTTNKRMSINNVQPSVQPIRRKSMFNRTDSNKSSFTIIKPIKKFLNGRYSFGRMLGQGTYGKVYECKDQQTSKIYALKQFSKDDPKIKNYVNKQISILKKLNHQNIVKFQGNFQVGKSSYILMEHCGLHNLKVYIKEKVVLSEDQARSIFITLVKSVKFLHERLIVHRDLKLQNILINSDGTVKLIDFGFSQQLQNEGQQLSSYCGTPTYMSPEIIRKTPYSGFKADCWALGMILYFMVTGSFPFVCRDQRSLFHCILRSTISLDSKLSSELRNLIRGMLTPDCIIRYSVDDILNSDWCGR